MIYKQVQIIITPLSLVEVIFCYFLSLNKDYFQVFANLGQKNYIFSIICILKEKQQCNVILILYMQMLLDFQYQKILQKLPKD